MQVLNQESPPPRPAHSGLWLVQLSQMVRGHMSWGHSALWLGCQPASFTLTEGVASPPWKDRQGLVSVLLDQEGGVRGRGLPPTRLTWGGHLWVEISAELFPLVGGVIFLE